MARSACTVSCDTITAIDPDAKAIGRRARQLRQSELTPDAK
jgi:hypothetical protein